MILDFIKFSVINAASAINYLKKIRSISNKLETEQSPGSVTLAGLVSGVTFGDEIECE